MPSNKNATTRYKILDELLSNQYHNYSLDDLTEEVNARLSELYPGSNGIGRRTIEKDLFYLEYEGPFSVEIERYSVQSYNKEKDRECKKHCLRYADPSFSIFKKEMTDDEKYLLSEALSLIGQFEGLPNLEALENFRKSLNSKHEDKKIISFTKNPLENSSILGELFTAISQKQVVEITYHKFNEEERMRMKIKIHPYLLKEYNRRWYLIAAAVEDEKLLNFGLDRIDDVSPLPSYQYSEYDGDLLERFEDIIGVTLFEDSPIHTIYFWVSDFSKDYVSTKPLHESQRKVSGAKESELRCSSSDLHGGQIFRIECRYNYELIRELSSFGMELIVLEPSEIQDKVFDRISSMYERYHNLRT